VERPGRQWKSRPAGSEGARRGSVYRNQRPRSYVPRPRGRADPVRRTPPPTGALFAAAGCTRARLARSSRPNRQQASPRAGGRRRGVAGLHAPSANEAELRLKAARNQPHPASSDVDSGNWPDQIDGPERRNERKQARQGDPLPRKVARQGAPRAEAMLFHLRVAWRPIPTVADAGPHTTTLQRFAEHGRNETREQAEAARIQAVAAAHRTCRRCARPRHPRRPPGLQRLTKCRAKTLRPRKKKSVPRSASPELDRRADAVVFGRYPPAKQQQNLRNAEGGAGRRLDAERHRVEKKTSKITAFEKRKRRR